MKKTFILSLLIISIFGLNSCKQNLSNEWFKVGSKPDSYEVDLGNSNVYNGKKSALIESAESEIDGFGTIMQTCSASEYLGKKIRMSGFIKTENVSNWSGMWLRIDSKKSQSPKYFDNMRDRQIKGTTNWKKYEIIMDIPTNSNDMNFGVLLNGTGKVWIDNISFEIIGETTEKFNDSLNIGITKKLLPKPTNLDFEE